ncbi:hypothetical protein LXL04_015333 [Taraxacum kok-saghyz]
MSVTPQTETQINLRSAIPFPKPIDATTATFPQTLVPKPTTLSPGNIHNFIELQYLFLTNFKQLQNINRDTHSITGCKQRECETIKQYFKYFTDTTLDVPHQEIIWTCGPFIMSHDIFFKTLSMKFLKAELKERVDRFYDKKETPETCMEVYIYFKVLSPHMADLNERFNIDGTTKDLHSFDKKTIDNDHKAKYELFNSIRPNIY